MKQSTARIVHIVLILGQFLIPAFTPGLTLDQHAAIAATIAALQGFLGDAQQDSDRQGNTLPPTPK